MTIICPTCLVSNADDAIAAVCSGFRRLHDTASKGSNRDSYRVWVAQGPVVVLVGMVDNDVRDEMLECLTPRDVIHERNH